MSLPVFLSDQPLLAGGVIDLSGAEGRHAVTVKRLTPGEYIELIDGHGTRARALVTGSTGKDTLHLIIEEVSSEPEPCPRVRVVQAVPKAERAELAVDLATQAGADEIIPWQAERCVARWQPKKAAKWQAAALQAAKQSRRSRVPVIGECVDTPALAAGLGEGLALVLHEEGVEKLSELDLTQARDITVIIGPEGGIGAAETARLVDAGARLVRLGPEVLRTASAAMVALAVIGAKTPRW